MCAKTSDTKRSEVNSEQQQNNIIIHIPTTRIRYEKIKQLGEGGFGKVFLAMNKANGQLLAMKQIRTSDEKETKALENELSVMQHLSHQHIVRYLGVQRKEKKLIIFMEYASGGSLQSLIRQRSHKPFTEPVIQNYTRQMLLGLNYLHSNNIIHRDVKSDNVLLDEKGTIKLADFGASKIVDQKIVEELQRLSAFRGTPAWLAPEVVLRQQYSFASDIWALGCTILEMLTGRQPFHEEFDGLDPFQIYVKIGKMKDIPPLPKNISEYLRDLLLRCFKMNPKERATAKELLKHPFICSEMELSDDDDDTELSDDKKDTTTYVSNFTTTTSGGEIHATQQDGTRSSAKETLFKFFKRLSITSKSLNCESDANLSVLLNSGYDDSKKKQNDV